MYWPLLCGGIKLAFLIAFFFHFSYFALQRRLRVVFDQFYFIIISVFDEIRESKRTFSD